MAVTVRFEEQVEIPLDIRSLADFRKWTQSDHFPESGRIDYLQGNIEVDMSPEDLHTHGNLKSEIHGVLWRRVKQGDLGEIYVDRVRVVCPDADLSAEPDVVFVSHAALDTGRVRLVPKAGAQPDRFIEMEGAPDLVVEIVSDTSVGKDTRRLPKIYYQAGVAEYWLVDAGGEDLLFRIHHRGPSEYEPAAIDPEGYQRSEVLSRSYRLTRSRHPSGRLAFDLHEKE